MIKGHKAEYTLFPPHTDLIKKFCFDQDSKRILWVYFFVTKVKGTAVFVDQLCTESLK